MLPVTGIQQGPGLRGQPIELGIDGLIDPTLLPSNYDPAIPVVADESLQSGDLCYFVNVGGVQKLRKALAGDQGTIASCFVKQNVSAGAAVKAFVQGLVALANTGTWTPSDVGKVLYLSTTVPGSFTATRPTTVGKWIQHVLTVAMVDDAFLYCFFTGATDPGHSVGSTGIDQTDPAVLAHIASTLNPHATTAAQVGAVPTTAVGVASGVAGLGADSLLLDVNLPATPWKRKKVKALTSTQTNVAAPGPSIDGVTMGIDDRVILTGQVAPEENGVYLWKGSALPLLRADDADTGQRLWAGIWFITAGNHAGQGWANTNATVPTLGTSPVTFSGVLGMPIPPGFQNPMTTPGDLIVGDVAGAATRLGPGTEGYLLTIVGGVPGWAQPPATSPMTASGDMIIGGTNGTMTRLAKSTDGKILGLVAGLPAWVAAPVTTVMTTLGDIEIGGAAGAPTRLPKGADGTVFLMVSGSPGWATAPWMTSPMSAAGDLIYGGAAGAPTRLAKGTDGQWLSLVAGSPAWADLPAGVISNPMTTQWDILVGGIAGAPTRFAKGADGQLLSIVAGALSWVANTTAAHWYIGSGTPGVGLGADGDCYLDIGAGAGKGNVWLKTAGTWGMAGNILGPQGNIGPAGIPGSTWYHGTGVPSNAIGINGDYYLDFGNGNVYQKAAGVYGLIGSIQGPVAPMPATSYITTVSKTVNPGETVYWYETIPSNRVYGVKVAITGGSVLPNSNFKFKLWGNESAPSVFNTLMYSGTFTDVLFQDVAQGWYYRDSQAAGKLRCSLTNDGSITQTLQFDIVTEPF
jgi:hypothetical protein